MTDKKPKRPRDANQLAKFISNLATGDAHEGNLPKNEQAAINGAKGGKIGGVERAKRLSSKERTAIAVKAARSRWDAQAE